MNIVFTPKGWQAYLHWQEKDKKVFYKINRLIKEICRDPFHGIGKPEPLKHKLQGLWSRRIDGEHRIVYQIADSEIRIISCRMHY